MRGGFITFLFAVVALATPPAPSADVRADQTSAKGPPVTLHIPMSIRSEHEAIHAALVEATRVSGRIGEAASALAKVLHPHFVREEEIALPPLGLLASLAAGRMPADVAAVLEMTDTLKREMPQMLTEHKAIRAAVEQLRVVAHADKNAAVERLAEDLAAHARTEEEVLYPAAILVGDVVRARQTPR